VIYPLQVRYKLYERVAVVDNATSANTTNRTVMSTYHKAPGFVVANLLRWVRGHPTVDKKNCTCPGLMLSAEKDCRCTAAAAECTCTRLVYSWREKIGGKVCHLAKPFTKHSFDATYFNVMLKDCIANLQLFNAIVVMDFAMNYKYARPSKLLIT
jgi:hypothetical protein